jgi:hypothetical protein
MNVNAPLDRKKDFKDRVVSGLKAAEVSPVSQQEIDDSKKAIFPILDTIFRALNDQNTSDNGEPKWNSVDDQVVEAAVTYFKDIFQAKNQSAEDPKFQRKYSWVARKEFEEKLNEVGVSTEVIGELDLTSRRREILKNPPQPQQINEVQKEALDGVDTGSEASQLTDEALSKKLSETFEPIINYLQENPDSIRKLQEIFKSISRDPNVPFSAEDLEPVKEKLTEALTTGDLNAVKEYLETINEGVKHQLSSYFQTVLIPSVFGGGLDKVSAYVDKSVQGDLKKALEHMIDNDLVKDRENAPEQEDVKILLKKRNYISNALVDIGKRAAKFKQEKPGFKVAEFFVRELEKLEGQVFNEDGDKVVIYKDDLKLIADHLEATKDIPQEKQKLDMSNFLKDYGKYAISFIPFILGPIASVMSVIPIIGKPIARLVPTINNIVQTSAPALLTLAATHSAKKEEKASENQVAQAA